jgi:hypothetical protein
MAHGRLLMIMPAPSAAAFEAFYNHQIRLKWDTLLKITYVEGGGTHPYRGAITVNRGRGWKSPFKMRTRFITYDSSRYIAAAEMVEPIGLFAHWAASMRHKDLPNGTSELIYTFSMRLRPRWLGKLLDPIAALLYRRETRARFIAMAQYLRKQSNCLTGVVGQFADSE